MPPKPTPPCVTHGHALEPPGPTLSPAWHQTDCTEASLAKADTEAHATATSEAMQYLADHAGYTRAHDPMNDGTVLVHEDERGSPMEPDARKP